MPENDSPEPSSLFSFIQFAGLSTLSKNIARGSKVVREQQNHISAIFKAVAHDFAKSYPQMQAAADRLADLGWTFPMLVTPKTLVALADQAYSDSDIETMLSDFYTDVSFEQLRIVQQDMAKSLLLARWVGLLDEAFENFYAGHYQIPVPALLAIIEGSVADESGNLNADIIRVRQMATDVESQKQPQSFDSLMWRSIHRWIDHLFAKAPFSGSQPSRLNRHWILHGRDAGPWTRTDVVRLFTGLHTLVS